MIQDFNSGNDPLCFASSISRGSYAYIPMSVLTVAGCSCRSNWYGDYGLTCIQNKESESSSELLLWLFRLRKTWRKWFPKRPEEISVWSDPISIEEICILSVLFRSRQPTQSPRGKTHLCFEWELLSHKLPVPSLVLRSKPRKSWTQFSGIDKTNRDMLRRILDHTRSLKSVMRNTNDDCFGRYPGSFFWQSFAETPIQSWLSFFRSNHCQTTSDSSYLRGIKHLWFTYKLQNNMGISDTALQPQYRYGHLFSTSQICRLCLAN